MPGGAESNISGLKHSDRGSNPGVTPLFHNEEFLNLALIFRLDLRILAQTLSLAFGQN